MDSTTLPSKKPRAMDEENFPLVSLYEARHELPDA